MFKKDEKPDPSTYTLKKTDSEQTFWRCVREASSERCQPDDASNSRITCFFDRKKATLHYLMMYPERRVDRIGPAYLRQRPTAVDPDFKCNENNLKQLITSHAAEQFPVIHIVNFGLFSCMASLLAGALVSVFVHTPSVMLFTAFIGLSLALAAESFYLLQDLNDLSRWAFIGAALSTILSTGGIGGGVAGMIALGLQVTCPTLLSTVGLNLGLVVCVGAGVGLLVAACILGAATCHYNPVSRSEKETIRSQFDYFAPEVCQLRGA